MTHMHIPDGFLPAWLWIGGFCLMAVFLTVSLFRLRTMDRRKNIPLLGAVAAVMLVAMNIPELVLPYHLNLSIVAGILLGPSLGFLAAFIVNLMLAFMGHGGMTVMGLNTVLLGAEVVMGHTFFFFLPGRMPVFWRAATATLFALCLASLLLIAIVGASHVDVGLFEAAGHDHGHVDGVSLPGKETVLTFAVVVLTFGAIGWIIEAAVTGAIIRFIAQVKPDLLAHILHKERCNGGPTRCTP